MRQLYAASGTWTPFALNYQVSGTGLTLTWPFGTLQQADQPGGPWSVVSNAKSPYSVTTSAARKFYRVKAQ